MIISGILMRSTRMPAVHIQEIIYHARAKTCGSIGKLYLPLTSGWIGGVIIGKGRENKNETGNSGQNFNTAVIHGFLRLALD